MPRRLRLLACLALIAAGLAGCGGGAAARRAAWNRWAHRADALCQRVEDRILARGGAAEYLDVRRIAGRAHADLHAAVGRLARLPQPEGGDVRARRTLAAARGVDAALGGLVASARTRVIPDELRAAERLRRSGLELNYAAGLAGLRRCGRDGLADDAADALIAPAVLTIAAQTELALGRRLPRVLAVSTRTPAALRRALLRASRITRTTASTAAAYAFEHAPSAANAQAQRFLDAMSRLGVRLRAAARRLTAARAEPHEVSARIRAMFAASRDVAADFRALVRRLRAIAHAPPAAGSREDPTAPAGGDGEVDA